MKTSRLVVETHVVKVGLREDEVALNMDDNDHVTQVQIGSVVFTAELIERLGKLVEQKRKGGRKYDVRLCCAEHGYFTPELTYTCPACDAANEPAVLS